MKVLNRLAKHSAKYRELENLVELQKVEIRELKAQRQERKAKAERKLNEAVATIVDTQLGIYPRPRLLVVKTGSRPLAERILELTGAVLAARLAHRGVCVDWRDGVLDAPGKNAFWSLFRSSPELLKRELREVDSHFFSREAPTLPPPAETASEDLEAWKAMFSNDTTQENQVLVAQGDPWWHERITGDWASQLSNRGQISLDDVERMVVFSLFRPKRRSRQMAAAAMDGVPIHKTLGAYLPRTSGAELSEQALAEWVATAMEAQKRELVWLLTDAPERREAFDKILGHQVIHLTCGQGEPQSSREASERLLAGYLALSHAPALALGGRSAEARLLFQISGLRRSEIVWLGAPQLALYGKANAFDTTPPADTDDEP